MSTLKKSWLDFILHFSAKISGLKQRMFLASPSATFFIALEVLVFELLLLIISLPAYLFIAAETSKPGQVVEEGVRIYRLRRTVSLSVVLGVFGIWLVVSVLGFTVGTRHIFADSSSWDFNEPTKYIYDPTKIQIADGIAILKAVKAPVPTQTISPVETPTPSIETPVPTPSVSVEVQVSTPVPTSVSIPTPVPTSVPTITPTPVPVTTAAPTVVPTIVPTVTPTIVATPTPISTATPTTVPTVAPTSRPLLFRGSNVVYAAEMTCSATLQPLLPLVATSISHWTGFTETANKAGGSINYQLSTDGVVWQYWNGSAWKTTLGTETNTAGDIDAHIGDFPVTTGNILFKAFFNSDCSHDVQLLALAIRYDQPAPVGFTLLSGDPGVTFTNAIGTPLTATTGYVQISYIGTPTVQVTLNGNLDLKNQVIGTGPLGSAWLGLDNTAISNINSLELIIPKSSSGAAVRMCPGALAAVSIIPGCVSETILSGSQTSVSGYTLVKLDDPTHWHIQISTSGQVSLGATEVIPEPELTVTPIPGACGIILDASKLSPATLLTKTLSTNDYVVTADLTISSTTTESGIYVRHEDGKNLWKLSFENGTVTFKGLINDSAETVSNANVVSFAPDLGAKYHIKIQVNQEQLRAKWWLDGESEPTSWLLYGADDRILSGGVGIITNPLNLLNPVTGLKVSNCIEDQTISSPEPVTTSVPATLPTPEEVATPTESVGAEPNATLLPSESLSSSSPTTSVPSVPAPAASAPAPVPVIHPFSLTTWVELSELGIDHTIVSQSDVFALKYRTDIGKLVFSIYDQDGNSHDVIVSAPLSTSERHLVAATYDGTDMRIYVDGGLSGYATAPPDVTSAHIETSAKWPSQGTHLELTVATPEEINRAYLASKNTPPSLTIKSVNQRSDGLVAVTYVLRDIESNYGSLPVAVYSRAGAFLGEEKAMTEATNDAADGGATGLTTTPEGIEHTFVWNPRADLGAIEDSAVHIALQPSDGIESGAEVTSNAFSLDLAAPVVTNLTAIETSGDIVHVGYHIADFSGAKKIELQSSTDDGATWTTLASTSATAFSWQAGKDMPNTETVLKLRIAVQDKYGNASVSTPVSLKLDTKAPFGLADLAGKASDTKSIFWSWSSVGAEANFDHYTLRYSQDKAAVEAGSGTGVNTWTSTDDRDLATMGTSMTLISGLSADTTYYAKVTAVDSFGHETISNIAAFATKAISLVNNVQGNSGSSSGGGGGSYLPPEAYSALTAPTEGFSFLINENAVETSATKVTLNLQGGPNTGVVFVSQHSDFHDAVQLPYSPTISWDLCPQGSASDCTNGTHTLYVKFATPWGKSSSVVSNSIVLQRAPSPSSVSQNVQIVQTNQTSSPPSGQSLKSAKTLASNAGFVLIKTLGHSVQSPILAQPSIASIRQSTVGNSVELGGKGIPHSKIALFIHSSQVVVVTTDTDADGVWHYTHQQNETALSPGEHTVYAVTYDPGSNIRSRPTAVQTFTVQRSRWSFILSYVDLWTTLLTIFVLGVVTIFFMRRKTTLAL